MKTQFFSFKMHISKHMSYQKQLVWCIASVAAFDAFCIKMQSRDQVKFAPSELPTQHLLGE